jgi:hypothetical protein
MDMHETHRQNREKLEECLGMLAQFDIRAKSSLWKFYNNCRKIWTELDKEMVYCRRRGKLSEKYLSLQNEFEECINVYKQWVTMAALSY